MQYKNFFMVPNRIFDLELKPRDFAVYCCLLRHSDRKDGPCFPSRRVIAKECSMDRKTVDSAGPDHGLCGGAVSGGCDPGVGGAGKLRQREHREPSGQGEAGCQLPPVSDPAAADRRQDPDRSGAPPGAGGRALRLPGLFRLLPGFPAGIRHQPQKIQKPISSCAAKAPLCKGSLCHHSRIKGLPWADPFAVYFFLTARRARPRARPRAAGITQPRFRSYQGRIFRPSSTAAGICSPAGRVLIRSNSAATPVKAVTEI